MAVDRFDVVVAGGAAMGSSVAWHLSRMLPSGARILVVERDPTYRSCASALSAASIRQQFSTDVNIGISLYGIAFLRGIAEHLTVAGERPEIGLVEAGYLYLASAAGSRLLSELNAMQRAAGADILLMEQADLSRRFPWLNVADLAVGSWGQTGEGWFDGWGLLHAFRRAARSKGTIYVADEIVAIKRDGDAVASITLASGRQIACGALVNCTGARGHEVAKLAAVDIPVRPKRRFVFTFTAQDQVPGCPLVIDTSGAYVRPEGEGFICGMSPPKDADPDWDDRDIDANVVDWKVFEEMIWPALAHRIPAFERIRPGRAWAGPYDMNLVDHNALVGLAPGLTNFYLCNGFSGHGLQQAPAIGRGLAELIVFGRFTTLDLKDLSPERLGAGRPLLERNVI